MLGTVLAPGYVRICLAAAAACCLLAVAPGCERRSYSQDTPDDVIASAVEMIKNGDTDRLGDLVYADTPEMRMFLDRLGALFGSMQGLAAACQEKFPQELAAMREEAAKRAADGKGNGLLSALMTAGNNRARDKGGKPPAKDDVRDLVNRLFADPYGWIERNAPRLSTLKTADDTAMVTLDDRPLLEPLGVPMRLDSGKWYVALPTQLPGVSTVMPRSREQWKILMSAVKVLDNAVKEMEADVRAGKVPSIAALGDAAQDKLLFPGMIAFGAYGKEVDVRQRHEKRMRSFTTKAREWMKTRDQTRGGPVSPRLREAIDAVASQELEAAVRQNKRTALDEMTPPQFEQTVTGWLRGAGLAIDLSGDVSAAAVDGPVDAWQAARAAAKAKQQKK